MTVTSTISDVLKDLPQYQKRTFVVENADLTREDIVSEFYKQLLNREIMDSRELEQWVLDRSELESAICQAGSILNILMTCQTDDEDRAKNYKHFIEKIVPVIKPLADECNKKFLLCRDQMDLPDHYWVYEKDVRAEVDLFVQENVALQTKDDLLSQEYQAVCGAMTVHFQGEEQTLPQMNKYLYDPDRDLRAKAWKAIAQRRLDEKKKLDEIFDKMVRIRHQISLNASCESYTEYKFRQLHRFDYTPKDCEQYHTSMEEVGVDLYQGICDRRKKQMKLEKLRPWDLTVDPLGRAALKPFDKVDKLIDGCKSIFNQVDDQLGERFQLIADKGLLDLSSRKGKAPGGYQCSLSEARLPFIFMNAVGTDDDMRTLLHESGHAFHALACREQKLLDYRHGPMEFNEVASMGMELIAGEYLSHFYDEAQSVRSKISHLEDIVYVLIWVATVDAFQHWIYANPQHTARERNEQWLKIRQRFAGSFADWDGLQEEQRYLWHRQLHIFEVPFYYIEYGIAQIGALQLWVNAKEDWQKAIDQYKNALTLGGSRPLPQLFKEAGLLFDFSASTIAPLMQEVQKELEELYRQDEKVG